MAKMVEIRNVSGSDVEFCGATVPAFGKLLVPYGTYLDVAMLNDMTDARISVKLPDRLDSQMDIRAFGAVGDGRTDDTYAIDRVLRHVESCGGGIVEVPAGVFLASKVVVPEHVTLVGLAIGRSALKKSGGEYDPDFVSGYGRVDGVAIISYGEDICE